MSGDLDWSAIEESQRMEGLRFVLNSPAWKEIYLPELELRCAQAYLMLKMEPEERKPALTDALLRARIWTLETVMSHGSNLLKDYDEARAQRDDQEAVRASYAQRAEDGRMAP